ncbi:MAG: SH3 domain-containing protein [Propionibacteriaceae bacterium]|nr:SH3 domain-containing protein [Propionibacteriaceae bacterium]
MAAPQRAFDTASETCERPRRAQLTFTSFLSSSLTNIAETFRSETPRRATQSKLQKPVLRIGLLTCVGVSVAALAAFAVPAPVTTELTPGAAFIGIAVPEVHPLTTGTISDSVPKKVAASLVSQTTVFANASLTVRSKPDQESKSLGTVTFGQEIVAMAETSGNYRLVEANGINGWVLTKELVGENEKPKVNAKPKVSEKPKVNEKPKANEKTPAKVSVAPCSRGTKVEAKLRPGTIKIYRSVCSLFPGVKSYGGWRAGGRDFHKNGRALDIMLTPYKDSKMGWQIAKYLTQHASEFNVDHVIFEQQIWTPSSKTWKKMANRGSITANHFDHVHVAIKA